MLEMIRKCPVLKSDTSEKSIVYFKVQLVLDLSRSFSHVPWRDMSGFMKIYENVVFFPENQIKTLK